MIDINKIGQGLRELQKEIAQKVKLRRKEHKLTQTELSVKAGVSLGSLKRFETTGEISLLSLVKIAIVLDCTKEFHDLFVKRHYQSIQDVIKEAEEF